MKEKIFVGILCLTFVLGGCATIRKNALKLSASDIKNAETTVGVAKNLLESWPVWSAALKRATKPYEGKIPSDAIKAWKELDQLACIHNPSKFPQKTEVGDGIEGMPTFECEKRELTWYEFGWSLGDRAIMLAEIVLEGIKQVAPEVLAKVPRLLGLGI